jgi:glycerophosphoryl diester phosphodiesterase
VNGLPLIIGHRGDSTHAPENTLTALRLAVEKGADGVEFDVQLAEDGVPVVIHDATLDRTGGLSASVAGLSSKQLGEIGVGSWFNRRFPAFASSEFDLETVPTLSEVLELFREFNGTIYIELKCGPDDREKLALAVTEIVRDSELQAQIIIKSFNLAVIGSVGCRLPGVRTAALFAPSIRHFLRRKRYIVDLAREIGAHEISIHRSLLGRGLLKHAAESHVPVTVWTVDDPAWVGRCQKLGVKALITNDPALMLAARSSLIAEQRSSDRKNGFLA